MMKIEDMKITSACSPASSWQTWAHNICFFKQKCSTFACFSESPVITMIIWFGNPVVICIHSFFSLSGYIMIIKFVRFQVPNYQSTDAASWSLPHFQPSWNVRVVVWMLVWNLFCSNPRWTGSCSNSLHYKKENIYFSDSEKKVQ
jgi:hypothetical protein